MSNQLKIIIVEKLGSLKSLQVKDYKQEELYKKCGFKKEDGFEERVEWGVKLLKQKYIVKVYAKVDGKSMSENKYDFPPPIDTTLFFGNCAIVLFEKEGKNNLTPVDITIENWNKIYEDLFGGFEDLTASALEDEMEEDELENIPAKYKTKAGYLKDGFVVDSESSDELISDKDTEGSYEDDEDDTLILEDDIQLENIGSELSEDEFLDEDDDEDDDEDENE